MSSAVYAAENSVADRDPARSVLRFAAGIAVCGMLLLCLMILAFALPAFQTESASPFSMVWAPVQGEFGILPMIAGSLMLAFSALVIGWPLAVALVCWLYCPHSMQSSFSCRIRAVVSALIRLMTAVPTVVYGFAAVFLLTPLVRGLLGGSGFCWLSAACMLSVLILPTIVLLLSAGIETRLESLIPSGLALGFTRLDLLYFFVLPQAGKTILASLILGFGRAVGDTLIPLMLAGNAPQIPEGIVESMRTLTAHMAMVTANEVGGMAYNSLFTAGAVLLLINIAVSLCAHSLSAEVRMTANGAGL